jgi:hypothetical protein
MSDYGEIEGNSGSIENGGQLVAAFERFSVNLWQVSLCFLKEQCCRNPLEQI